MAKAQTPKPNDVIEAQVDRALQLERVVAEQVKALKTAQEQIDATWAAVKEAMVKHNVKSLKGKYGSITVAERTTFKTDMDKLPEQFKKLAPDTAKIGTYYALMGETPDGAEPVVTKYLTKRLK